MPSPRVKVDHHIAAGRQRLAAQHVARRQFIRFGCMAAIATSPRSTHLQVAHTRPRRTADRRPDAMRHPDAVVFGAEGDKPIAPVRRMVTVRPSACTPAARFTLPPGY